jgi:hypothetical protein
MPRFGVLGLRFGSALKRSKIAWCRLQRSRYSNWPPSV